MLVITYSKTSSPALFCRAKAAFWKPGGAGGILTLPYRKETFLSLSKARREKLLAKIPAPPDDRIYPDGIAPPPSACGRPLFQALLFTIFQKAIRQNNLKLKTVCVAANSDACLPLVLQLCGLCKIVSVAGNEQTGQAVSDAVMERCGAAVSFFDKSRPIQADGVIAFDFEPRLARAPLLYLGYDKPQNPCVRRYIDHSKITVRLGENYEFLQSAIGRKVNLNDAHIILKSKYNNYNLDDFHRENFQISQSIN